jgi:hypothetical protein
MVLKEKEEFLTESYYIDKILQKDYAKIIGTLQGKTILEVLKEKFGKYCSFKEIPDENEGDGMSTYETRYSAVMFDTQNRTIKINILERFSNPDSELLKINLDLKYDKNISKKDLKLLRKNIQESGLTKRVGGV